MFVMTKTTGEFFRISEEEKRVLKLLAKREGITKGEYLRNVINNQVKVFTLSPDEVLELRKEFANLTRYGSSVNQIAYHLNVMALNNDVYLTKKHQEELKVLLEDTNKSLDKTRDLIIELIEKKK